MTESARGKPIVDSGIEGQICCRLFPRRSDLFPPSGRFTDAGLGRELLSFLFPSKRRCPLLSLVRYAAVWTWP